MNRIGRAQLFLFGFAVAFAVTALALSFTGTGAAPTRATTNSLYYDCSPTFYNAATPATWPVGACGWLFFEHTQPASVIFTNVTVEYQGAGGNQYNQLVVSVFDGAWQQIGVYAITQPGYGTATTSVDLSSSGATEADRTGTQINIRPAYDGVYTFISGQFNNIDVSFGYGGGAEATPLPFATSACITGTTSTVMPTRTPFGFTATPTRTPTPGGPTATRTPTPNGTPNTPTPQAIVYDSGTIRFNSNLSPFTFIQYTGPITYYKTEWQNATGIDNLPGVAYVKDAYSITENDTPGITTTNQIPGALVLSSNLMSFPLSVSGYMRVAGTLHQGEGAWLNLWYFDPDYSGVGHGAWVAAKAIKADGQWNRFSAVINQLGGSGKVSAIAIGEFEQISELFYGLWLDEIRVTSGKNFSHLPNCGTGGGGGGSGGGNLQSCTITIVSQDAFSACVKPTSLIDVPQWISYWFCWLGKYFEFGSGNTRQLSEIQYRQSINEPIGTLLETKDVFDLAKQLVTDILAINNSTNYRAIDFSSLLNWSSIDEPPNFDISQAQIYDGPCDLQIHNVSSNVYRAACWVMNVARDERVPLVSLLQWAVDIGSVVMAWLYVQNNFFAKN